VRAQAPCRSPRVLLRGVCATSGPAVSYGPGDAAHTSDVQPPALLASFLPCVRPPRHVLTTLFPFPRHLMLRAGLLSPHSKLLPRSVMSPSPEPVPDLPQRPDLGDAAHTMSDDAQDGLAERYAPSLD
jgi:hypothetical protein